MSVYVMSDIHGEGDLFHAMLKQIDFSSNDSLYILGDVIDRGPDGIDLLREIYDTPNMNLLLGNHEYMMLQCCQPQVSAFDSLRWNRNGNFDTLRAFRRLEKKEQLLLIRYLSDLPTHLEVSVAGVPYYLTHGYPSDDPEEEVWKRPELHERNPKPGRCVVIGHTPVLNLVVPRDERPGYIQLLQSRNEHPKILYASGFIDVDCGCSFSEPIKTLGCLRLDDLEEFYERKQANHLMVLQTLGQDAV